MKTNAVGYHHGITALFDFTSAHQETSESINNFLQMEKVGSILLIWTVFCHHLTTFLPISLFVIVKSMLSDKC